MAWEKRSGRAPIYRTKAHRQARAALLAAFVPGQPCVLCGEGMYPPLSQLHADHWPGTDEYRGLAHAQCNVRDAAQRANARQRYDPDRVTRLQW